MRRLVFAACIAGALALAPPSRRVRRVFACHALALRGGVGGAPPSASVVAAATGAVSRLVATTALGAAAVKTEVVTPEQISAIARVVYNFFLPCFLFCAIVETVTSHGVSAALVAMPAAAAAQVAVAFAVSRTALLPLLGVRDPGSAAAREVLISGSFGNPGVLPLLFFDALFAGAARSRLVAFTSFYLAGFTPVFWALGNAILGDDDRALGRRAGPAGRKRRRAAAAFLRPPPVRAALAGVAVAASPLRAALAGDRAVLAPAYAAIRRFADAYLPTASLVLAGSLVAGADDAAGAAPTAPPTGLARTVAALCVHRFVVLPAVGAVALAALAAARVVPPPRAAPLLWFFLLTQFSMPPAQNTVVMFQLRDDRAAAARQARALLLTYAAAAAPLAALFTVYLRLCGL